MWKFKKFTSAEAQNAWIDRNKHRYQITVLFINNGYGVEYRQLVHIRAAR